MCSIITEDVIDEIDDHASQEILTHLQEKYTLTRFVRQCYHDNESPINEGEKVKQPLIDIEGSYEGLKTEYSEKICHFSDVNFCFMFFLILFILELLNFQLDKRECNEICKFVCQISEL